MYLLLKNYLLMLVFTLVYLPGYSQTATGNLPAAPTAKLNYTLWLVGNTGDPGTTPGNKLQLLQKQIAQADTNSTLVFMGNTFYPEALPNENSPKRAAVETKLKSQLEGLKNYPGNMYLVPGGYGKKGKNPSKYRRQERFISDYLGKEKLVQPENMCPGPVELHLSEDLLLLLVDTQWFLPGNELPAEGSSCEITRPSLVMAQIDDILRNYPEKQVVVAAHVSPEAKSLEYRYLRKSFAPFLRQHPGLVLVESNGRALYHQFADSLHYVSTGSVTPHLRTPAKHATLFSATTPGFAKINFYNNGEAWLEFWTAQASAGGEVAYRTMLMRKPTQAMLAADLKTQTFDFSDSTVTASASQDYLANGFTHWLMGDNYREEWATKVKLPVFDIGKVKGGLKVLQQGGGFQTRSLRLADAQGKEYVLRSVEKYPANALPRALRQTVAADVVKDQISASHPYGPLVIPALSKAAKVYHTNPVYYYIPDDPRFGKYRVGFANTVGLFEERADDDQSDAAYFGNSKKVQSSAKVLENIQEDNDIRVDQSSVLRARLFDFIVGDWDRHEDQWRWARFDVDSNKTQIYQPIPRDRDMVFFVNQGVLPKIGSRKWLLPKVQGFDEEYRDIASFNFNARYFDRLFLTRLSLADWQKTAQDLKASLSDAEIEKAVRQLPEPVFKTSGPTIIANLKSHRDHLPEDATEYYKFLAKEVNVVGSDKNEQFDVVRRDDENTQVTVRKINKEGKLEQTLYDRTFKTSETKEIRLFGLEGNNIFNISGEVNKGPKVRVIGGDEKDVITDKSTVRGINKKTIIYDTPNGNEFNLGSEAKNMTSADTTVNYYNPRAFKYDYFGPLGALGYNRDDGFFVGAGTLIQKQGFQKEPFASSHRVLGRYAFLTKSFRLDYTGYFTDVIRKLDMQVNVDLRTPDFAENFFGLGNETTFDADEYKTSREFNYFRYRSKQYYVNTLFGTKLGKHHSILFGPAFQSVDVNFVRNDFLANNLGSIEENPNLYALKNYVGVDFRYDFDSRDEVTLPTKGNFIRVGASAYKGISSTASDYQQIAGEWRIFHTIRIPLKLTVSNRIGAGHTFGRYEFFQANVLDGNTNLRGYRRNRFAGGSSVYNNTDLRLRLFTFQSYLFPGSLGIIGFHDVGRVWEEGEKSSTWHRGYGGGLWVSPVNMFIFSAEYAISRETRMPLLRAAFLF